MKILHIHNNWKWYDMIERGEKPEEYRDLKWIKQACKFGSINGQKTYCAVTCPTMKPECRQCVPTDYTHLCIWRGYTKTNMLWTIEEMTIGIGNPKWGAPDFEVLIIKLKERVK